MSVEDLFDGLAEIIDGLETIGNLDGLWGATRRSLGVGGAPVAGHELDAGMDFKPAGDGGRCAILEQLAGPMLIGIHQDRAKDKAAPLTPVIHTHYTRGTHRRQRGFRDQPQQRRATRLEAMPSGQSCSRLTALGTGEIEQKRVLASVRRARRGRARRHQVRQSLGEDSAWTPSIATEETPNLDVQYDTSAAPRKVSEGALIAAVDAARTP